MPERVQSKNKIDNPKCEATWMQATWIKGKMVRAVGIEPTLLAERDFESRASTSSTTPA
jgi:hypothetical protein